MKETRVYFNGETKENGAYIQNAMVVVSEEYTMTELVKAIKEAGYRTFMLQNMNRLARVPENI